MGCMKVTVIRYDSANGVIQAACAQSQVYRFNTGLWSRIETSDDHHGWRFGTLHETPHEYFPKLTPGLVLYVAVDGKEVTAWCTRKAVTMMSARRSKRTHA